jgi:Transcriptional regulator
MNTLQIKYFLTAARCLNFTEAAKQLYISQPALSQQILALEKELNMQLFIRAKKEST